MADQPSLAGPLARIDRADDLSPQLTTACKAFLETRPYTVEERPDENPTTRAFVVTALHAVPILPRNIAGEIAHHLRASLDLLVYQLMLRNGVTDEKLLKRSVFPVLDKDLATPQGRGEYHAAIKKAIGPLPAPLRAHRGVPARQHESRMVASGAGPAARQHAEAPAAARCCGEHTAQRLELPQRDGQGHDHAAPFVRPRSGRRCSRWATRRQDSPCLIWLRSCALWRTDRSSCSLSITTSDICRS